MNSEIGLRGPQRADRRGAEPASRGGRVGRNRRETSDRRDQGARSRPRKGEAAHRRGARAAAREPRGGPPGRARGEGAGDRRRRGAARRDRGPRRGRRGAGQGGRAPRLRGRGADRRRGSRRPRGGGRLAARPGQDDPPRGGRAIAEPAGEFDVAVVGGGAAGLWTALRAAEDGGRVCLVSRTPLSQSASYWAQGGLAAALEPDDSPARHAADTIAAGRGLCRTAAVRVLVEEAPGGGPRPAGPRGRVRPRPGGPAGARARGRPREPPHRPLRRQPDRPRDHLEAGGDGRRSGARARRASGPRRWRSGATASAATA